MIPSKSIELQGSVSRARKEVSLSRFGRSLSKCRWGKVSLKSEEPWRDEPISEQQHGNRRSMLRCVQWMALVGFVFLSTDRSPALGQSTRPVQAFLNSSQIDSLEGTARSPKRLDETLSPQDRMSQLFGEASRSLSNSSKTDEESDASFLMSGPEKWTSPKGLTNSLQVLLLLTVLSLAPAILLMTTCYVRIIVVLGLLRTAIGTPQLPPSQVVTSIALFMTLFIMAPVWTEVYDEAIKPYSESSSDMSLQQAFEKGADPVRRFMSRQIIMAANEEDVHLFYSHYAPDSPPPLTSTTYHFEFCYRLTC